MGPQPGSSDLQVGACLLGPDRCVAVISFSELSYMFLRYCDPSNVFIFILEERMGPQPGSYNLKVGASLLRPNSYVAGILLTELNQMFLGYFILFIC